MSDGKLYYVMIGDQRVGPIDIDALRDLAQQGRLTPSTLFWTQGMETWIAMAQSPLGSLLSPASAPFPPPGPPGITPASLYGGAAAATARPASFNSAGFNSNSYGAAGVGFAPEMAATPGIGFVEAIKLAFSKYATFAGRASRSEYWWYTLFTFLVSLLLSVIFAPLYLIFALGVFLPSLAVAARRLHDIDRTGWWLLLCLVPVVGPIILLIFLVLPPTAGQNRFG
ncbi:MAG: DUF805 domain-containing protein [Hyphomicrobiaceae bacterium]|nr:DUF805 domain-containing protein [Hyphomicrobiaceae bacterium]